MYKRQVPPRPLFGPCAYWSVRENASANVADEDLKPGVFELSLIHI